MANADCLTFKEMSELWMLCTPDLLLWRYERMRPIATSDPDTELLVRMLDKYLEDIKPVRRRKSVEGDERGAEVLDLVIQKGHDDRYAGPLRHGRFQVMESLTPADTFYIVDHSIHDLLVRENGPASATRRFPSREAAEKETDRLAERPAEITLAARRRGGIDIPPSGKVRGIIEQENEDMARPKKAETAEKAPKKADMAPEKKTKDAAATGGAAVKGKGKNGAGAASPAATSDEKKAGPGRKSVFDPKAKIVVVAATNPRRAGSNAANRYDFYKKGTTVEKAFASGISSAALADDIKTEVVRLG